MKENKKLSFAIASAQKNVSILCKEPERRNWKQGTGSSPLGEGMVWPADRAGHGHHTALRWVLYVAWELDGHLALCSLDNSALRSLVKAG